MEKSKIDKVISKFRNAYIKSSVLRIVSTRKECSKPSWGSGGFSGSSPASGPTRTWF